jgi:hypothetical protein
MQWFAIYKGITRLAPHQRLLPPLVVGLGVMEQGGSWIWFVEFFS